MEAGASAADREGAGAAQDGQLKRAVTRRMLVFFIVGDMLGGGIYALVGEVGGEVGGAIWTAFLAAFVLAGFTAGAYAELVTKYPRAGGAALYADKAFRIPLVTFLVGFAVMCSSITSASALANAFGGDYLSEFVELPAKAVALAVIAIVTLVNLRGISESAKLNVGFTIVEVSGLVLIILIGVAALVSGDADPGRALEFKQGSSVPLLVLAGAALAFYALLGFEDSVNVAEEVDQPRRAYPTALLAGVVIAGTIYVLVALVAGMVVPTETLAGSDGPLLEVVKAGPLPVPTLLFAAIALFALANTCLINMIVASRVLYGMAEQGIISSFFARVHASRRTPTVAIVFTTALSVVLVLTGDLEALADTTVTLLLCAFVIVNIAVLVLRRTPVEHDHFRVPTVVPVIGALVCLGLLTQVEAATFFRAGLLILLGLVLWVVNRLVAGRTGDVDPGKRSG